MFLPNKKAKKTISLPLSLHLFSQLICFSKSIIHVWQNRKPRQGRFDYSLSRSRNIHWVSVDFYLMKFDQNIPACDRTTDGWSYYRVIATAKLTGDGKQETFEQLLCSADLTAGIHGQLAFISVLNIFLSITAFFGNVLILAALRKESSLHLPSKLLLHSLATTDLCVGLISYSVTRPSSTAKRTEHSAIRKGSVLCTVVATDVSRLLSTLWCSDVCVD